MLKELYKNTVAPQLSKDYGNVMSVPQIEKVCINVGFGREVAKTTGDARRKIMDMVSTDLGIITGQKAIFTKARKSIAGFKIRDGLIIGAKVTLRRQMMWDFLERYIYLSLPRSRDFKGLDPKSVDKNGNLSMGFKEHISFPEIFTEKEKTIFGLEITVATNAKSKEEGLELYKLLGFPMKETK
jgi:large subunit ribosomal protein L5